MFMHVFCIIFKQMLRFCFVLVSIPTKGSVTLPPCFLLLGKISLLPLIYSCENAAVQPKIITQRKNTWHCM